MEKAKENKKLSVSEQMKAGEKLGAKVAKIMNKARAQANKVLAESGYEVNINVDFLKLESKTQEVDNG